MKAAMVPDGSPLLDFDERDLFAWAEQAGFQEVRLTYEAQQVPEMPVRLAGTP